MVSLRKVWDAPIQFAFVATCRRRDSYVVWLVLWKPVVMMQLMAVLEGYVSVQIDHLVTLICDLAVPSRP